LTLLDPFFVHNLRIFPIAGELGEDGYTTLEEAITASTITIEDTRGVNEVILQNNGNAPIFAIDGEELLGARQNRILNTDIYAEPLQRYTVPVTCIEQHRWHGEKLFSEAGFTVTPSLRSTLALSVKESLDKKAGYQSNQNLIWNKISQTLKATKVQSLTSSFHDIYKTMGSMVEEIVEDFESIQNAVGFSAYINDEFIAMDIFGTNSLYRKFEKKLLKSYILDGYIRKYTKEKGAKIKPEEVIELLSNSAYTKYPACTKGEELRALQNDIISKIYLIDDNPVHISAFAVAKE